MIDDEYTYAKSLEYRLCLAEQIIEKTKRVLFGSAIGIHEKESLLMMIDDWERSADPSSCRP